MHSRIERWLEILRTGFWFVPSLMLLLASALALALLHLDGHVDPGLKATVAWAYSGGPEGARSLLSTIAGSMITAASVTFSLASVALSIASQQYGSRVLRNFMRDRVTQVLLGTFVSTFIYSVLVVRAIRGSNYSGFVPAISTTVAIALSLISLIMLIYFVHHVSTSIQASHIISVIADDLHDATVRLYPSETGAPLEAPSPAPPHDPSAAYTVQIHCSGYLETIDLDTLLQLADHHDLILEILVKPGDHLLDRQQVVHLTALSTPADLCIDPIRAAFAVGKARTPTQDIRYQFQQLTDVVCRALSPGINDPFTAVNGIDELAGGLSFLARQPRVEPWRQGKNGAPRLRVLKPRLAEVMAETVGHMAIYGAADHFVMDRLRRTLDLVEPDLVGEAEHTELRNLRADIDRRQQAKAA